jgi:EmrB/QacA subfamily drug resistance transporter
VLVATVLGSALVSLDATVVNVALPSIGSHLHAQLAGLQWVLTGYLLTLASLILVGGALGDRYGRRRVFRWGVVLFVGTSAACAAAPNLPVLVAARVLQGCAGALLLPGSLAILQASFAPGQRGRAIGAWSAFGGVANAFGPFLGGWLVEAVSWRLVFLLNVPLGIVVVAISGAIPETRDETATGPVDLPGAATLTVGLGGVTFALIRAGSHGPFGQVAIPALVGIAALVVFATTSRTHPNALIPPGLFASPLFRATNAVTLVLYTALGSLFLITIELQNALGYSPIEAGAALLPLTVIMLALSARSGALAERIGPRLPMTVGSFLASAGLFLFSRIGPGSTYVADVLPAATVFGFGIAAFVAPLTAAVLSSAPIEHVSIASGVNNAIARVGGLMAVAALPALAGLSGDAYRRPLALTHGYRTAMVIAAALAAAAGALSWVFVRPPREARAVEPLVCCPIDATPLR